MTTKYKHCYSNYVNHILNTSPTKITYTFSKGQRFPSPKKENNAPVDKILQKNIHPDIAKKYNVEIPLQTNFSTKNMINNYLQPQNQKQTQIKNRQTHNPKAEQNRLKSKSQNIQNFPIDKYIGKQPKRAQQKLHVTFQRSPIPKKHSNQQPLKPQGEGSKASDINISNTHRRKVWEKGEDPFERQRFPDNCLYKDPLYHYEPPEPPLDYLPLRLLSQPPLLRDPYSEYLKYPSYYPSYGQKEQKLQQMLTKSREKSSKKLNRSLSQIEKTRHQRVKTTSDVLRQMDHPSKNITNHGYYPVGTEIKADGKYPLSTYKNVLTRSFGQPSDSKSATKGNVSNRKDKVKKKQSQMTRGVSTANLPKGFESYTPFSEFGYVQPFKY